MICVEFEEFESVDIVEEVVMGYGPHSESFYSKIPVLRGVIRVPPNGRQLRRFLISPFVIRPASVLIS